MSIYNSADTSIFAVESNKKLLEANFPIDTGMVTLPTNHNES